MTKDENSPSPSDDPSATDPVSSPGPEYKVGPGYPPIEHQFKKGAPMVRARSRTSPDEVR
jgi:hypothetical protein